MVVSLTFEPAEPPFWEAALRLVFQHLAAADRRERVTEAQKLLRTNELDPAGLWVARQDHQIVGAMVATPLAGASALVWPPQVLRVSLQREIEDRLVQSVSEWLRFRGAKLAQAMLAPAETWLAAPLERSGFRHVTSLWYMRREMPLLGPIPAVPGRLRYESYGTGNRVPFHATLQRSYEGTLDCPEVNGIRDIDEVITGHRLQGVYHPERWWLALRAGQPVGVLLLAEMKEAPAWDIAYLGVVPEARRHGVGRELVCKALHEARAAGAMQVTLSVDARNRPAQKLYRDLGFEPVEPREVYLAIWKN